MLTGTQTRTQTPRVGSRQTAVSDRCAETTENEATKR